MKLDTFRDAVMREAREEAGRLLDAAERDARRVLDEARERADDLVERARREGREAAEREMRRRRAEAQREARTRVQEARRDAVDHLRRRGLELLRERRGTEEYAGLMERLGATARDQLGSGVRIETGDDGLVASVDGRRVDYRLPALVDRLMEELGGELEELWR